MLFLTVITVQNLSDSVWTVTWDWAEMWGVVIVTVWASEFLVDWFKHAFVAKFNGLYDDVYAKFRNILCYDLTALDGQNTLLDRSQKVGRRMGFVALPMACLVLRQLPYLFSASLVPAVCTAFMLFLCLCALKILLSIHILGYALTKKKELSSAENRDEMRKEETAFEGVERYALIKGRLY
eukprot:TRINITY_DN3079_c0_g1_i4.p3 TRINITY_DN3079_c0_g1~~TRINITY_DN3079_c0_g1_i4.p3  ORF type:complete len:181 (+),score=45.66 TRINITY_DN3079_c0_g1_i4:806-1348(+)